MGEMGPEGMLNVLAEIGEVVGVCETEVVELGEEFDELGEEGQLEEEVFIDCVFDVDDELAELREDEGGGGGYYGGFVECG